MKPQVIKIAIVTSCSYTDTSSSLMIKSSFIGAVVLHIIHYSNTFHFNTVSPHLHIHVHEDFGAYSELKETKCYAHLKGFLDG